VDLGGAKKLLRVILMELDLFSLKITYIALW
jgi:hypothetical protein